MASLTALENVSRFLFFCKRDFPGSLEDGATTSMTQIHTTHSAGIADRRLEAINSFSSRVRW